LQKDFEHLTLDWMTYIWLTTHSELTDNFGFPVKFLPRPHLSRLRWSHQSWPSTGGLTFKSAIDRKSPDPKLQNLLLKPRYVDISRIYMNLVYVAFRERASDSPCMLEDAEIARIRWVSSHLASPPRTPGLPRCHKMSQASRRHDLGHQLKALVAGHVTGAPTYHFVKTIFVNVPGKQWYLNFTNVIAPSCSNQTWMGHPLPSMASG
jgi:hypothetical protein